MFHSSYGTTFQLTVVLVGEVFYTKVQRLFHARQNFLAKLRLFRVASKAEFGLVSGATQFFRVRS